MIKVENHYLGYIETTISEVYKSFPEFFDGFSLFLTCLDSDTNLSNNKVLLDLLKTHNCEYKVINKSIYLNGINNNFLFESKRIFTHFDEIYFINKDIHKEIKIPHQFTTDSFNFQNEIPNEFLKLLNETGASRYLSDGCGLNFACESETVAKDLVSHLQGK